MSQSLRLLAFSLSAAVLGAGCSGRLIVEQPLKPLIACDDDTDCLKGEECKEGLCRDKPPACSPWVTDGACPEGLACDNGVCCTGGDCGGGGGGGYCENCLPEQGCEAGECKDINSDNRCSPSIPNGLCSNSEVCIGGTCVACLQEIACGPANLTGCCGPGAACDAGFCVLLEDPTRACGPDNQTGVCDQGYRCDAGVCVVATCSADYPFAPCESTAKRCVGGLCEFWPCGPAHLDGVCEVGKYCSTAGECILENECLTEDDCADTGQTCSVVGECIFVGQCLAHDDCPTEFECGPAQFCIPATDCSRGCLEGKYCSAEDICIPNDECRVDFDCLAISDTFCSAADRCIPLGTCAVTEDCDGQVCAASGTCLLPGQCAEDEDCRPGFSCTAPNCVPIDPCSQNQPEGDACHDTASPGASNDCCASGQRCADPDGAGSDPNVCIPRGRCLSDADCLAGYYHCDDEGTAPTYTCIPDEDELCSFDVDCVCDAPDCTTSERCTFTGVCAANGTPNSCQSGTDCAPSELCNSLFECETSAGCNAQDFAAELVKPNMLIVLDRSGSMGDNGVAGATLSSTADAIFDPVCNTNTRYNRWAVAFDAIQQVTGDNESQIRFGLTTYPHICYGLVNAGITACTGGNQCNWHTACGYSKFNSASVCNATWGCAWNGSACRPVAAIVGDPDGDGNLNEGADNISQAGPDVPVDEGQAATIVNKLLPPTFAPNNCTSQGNESACNALPNCVWTGSACNGSQYPSGWTPTDRALRSVRANRDLFKLPDPADTAPRNNYIMLITDGDANNSSNAFGDGCDNPDTNYYQGSNTSNRRVACGADLLRTSTPKVNTYAVAFGGGLGADGISGMNCTAFWGGTYRCGVNTAGKALVPENQACTDRTSQISCAGCTWTGPSTCSGPSGCSAFNGNQAGCIAQGLPGCSWASGACSGGYDNTSCDQGAITFNGRSTTCYYDAGNAAALSAAFAEIAGSIASCDYTLDVAPPSPNLLFVYSDKTPFYDHDGNSGTAPIVANATTAERLTTNIGAPGGYFTFDAATNKVTFGGQACTDLQSGVAKPVIIQGCCQPGETGCTN